MGRFVRITLMILTLCCVGMNLQLSASGTYPGGPPRKPTRVDTTQYELGKAIFNSKTPVRSEPDPSSVAQQRERLEELQKQLPRGVQRDVDITALAGRLTTDQFKALEYFLQIRYNAK